MPAAARRAREEIEPLLDEAARAFERGRPEKALAAANQALERSPRSPEALHYRAAAELDLGDVEKARQSYERALKLAPSDPEIMLGLADLLVGHAGENRDFVEEGIRLCAKGRKLSREDGDGELVFEFWLVEGMALNQLGQSQEAVKCLDEALRLQPDSVEAALERGLALFELCRFDSAKKTLERVASRAPDEAWAHHTLGLIAERRGDATEARRRFAKAQSLSPEDFPAPVRLRDDEFDAAVEDALRQLPDHVRKHLDPVTISVEPFPSDEDLMASRPPLSPVILGLFRGTPVGDRSLWTAADPYPVQILLFQRNLERFARTRDELLEQIGITVMHEVGHLIGLDEEELVERGLE